MAISQLPGLAPHRLDEVLIKIEVAFAQVRAAAGSIVRLPKAELDLLSQLEVARDFMMAVLQSSDRSLLVAIFGGDCTRICRLRFVLDAVQLSEMNAADQRLQTCLRSCSSVEQVLEDLGLGWALRKAREEEREIWTKAAPVPDTKAGKLGDRFEREIPQAWTSEREDEKPDVSIENNVTEEVTEEAETELKIDTPIVIINISDSEVEDEGDDSADELCPASWCGNENAERHKRDLDLLLHQQQRLQARRTCTGRASERTSVQLRGEAPSAHADLCVEHVVAGLIAESRAFELDRSGKAQRAVKQYRRCAECIKSAIQAAEPAHACDKQKLEEHLQEVQARIRYLHSLDPIGRPPPIQLEHHIHPVTLEMQVPPIQFVRANDTKLPSPGHDWKTFAACAALGAAGGFMVLGGAAALSAVGFVGSLATTSAVGTGGALGSFAGAAAGAHCATRKDSIGAVARRAGHVTAKKVEKVGNRAVVNAEKLDNQYGLSQMMSASFDAVSSRATATAKEVSEEVSAAWQRSPSFSAMMTRTPNSAHRSASECNIRPQSCLDETLDPENRRTEGPRTSTQGKNGPRRRASSSAATGSKVNRRATRRSYDGVNNPMMSPRCASSSSSAQMPVEGTSPQQHQEQPGALGRGNNIRRASYRGKKSSKRASSAAASLETTAESKQGIVHTAADFLQMSLPESIPTVDSSKLGETDGHVHTEPSTNTDRSCRRRRHSHASSKRQSTKARSQSDVGHIGGDFDLNQEKRPEPREQDVHSRPQLALPENTGALRFPRSSPMAACFADESADAELLKAPRHRRRSSSSAAINKGRKPVTKDRSTAKHEFDIADVIQSVGETSYETHHFL